jgi:hypothetical protein
LSQHANIHSLLYGEHIKHPRSKKMHPRPAFVHLNFMHSDL